jgi:hypothetical protein
MTSQPAYELTKVQKEKAEKIFKEKRNEHFQKMDRMFMVLMGVQWMMAILIAVVFSPYAWAGKQQVFHIHLLLAVFMGGGISLFPILLAYFKPGWVVTRHVIAFTQMLWSALFIHLTGGRIETHFHVFVSLAFIAFYFDWTLLLNATLVVVADHLLRGYFYPESVYGIINPEWWRFLEHAFWVIFEDIVLVWSCVTGVRSMKEAANKQVEVEALLESNQLKSAALEMTLAEVRGAKKR